MRDRQCAPSVTAADVERVARRDFPGVALGTILGILSAYGTEDWQREVDRVRLAILKLSKGSLTDLRYWTEQAKCDYRDVLGPAEYPEYGRRRWSTDEEHNEIVRSDWKQYERWLKR